MENYRYKNVEEIKSEEDNFEILKCQLTGKPLYKNVQWSCFVISLVQCMAIGLPVCCKH